MIRGSLTGTFSLHLMQYPVSLMKFDCTYAIQPIWYGQKQLKLLNIQKSLYCKAIQLICPLACSDNYGYRHDKRRNFGRKYWFNENYAILCLIMKINVNKLQDMIEEI